MNMKTLKKVWEILIMLMVITNVTIILSDASKLGKNMVWDAIILLMSGFIVGIFLQSKTQA